MEESTSSSYESCDRILRTFATEIIEKGKQEGSKHIYNECVQGTTVSLNNVVDLILNPHDNIDNLENIDWCKWLIAGGLRPDEFTSIVKTYDNHLKCGLVWIPHVVAYRCRTCAISPCMSICRNCFKNGDHSTHDFNMFLSQAGGACDCGDKSVMKADGFCSDHGMTNDTNSNFVPKELMAVAEELMPSLLLRLLYHFRDGGDIRACDAYCNMLMELNNMGELMRNVMTKTLLDKELYTTINAPDISRAFAMYKKNGNSLRKYEEAKSGLRSPKAPFKYKDFPALQSDIVHSSLLEELIFWTFKYEFPQNFVCFLLNMLPDPEYKEQLTRTFVMHYSRIPKVLETSSDPDTLSNRVVHMSVQLFSNESLALKMVEELNLLHVMIISLKSMMSQNLIRNTLHDESRNAHHVIDCAEKAMREHCYWPLVSDFNNVLSHESVALVFLRDDDLVHMWFEFLSMLQGMNVNVRELGTHIEYEPSSYYAAFSCELEASAYPMWSIISHLTDSKHAQLGKKIIMFCTNYLQDWLKSIYKNEVTTHGRNEMMRASFHFPLHRYLAAFTCQAISKMNMSLKDIIPPPELLTTLMLHPLRVQSFFYEILANIWIRNGLQIKGQAMTYIQANFCNSMVDMDLFFLQICAIQLPPKVFLRNTIESFGVGKWLGMGNLTEETQKNEQNSMMEGLLTFLATVVSSRTNLGNDEKAQCIIEISALLATGDKTHSQLLELMPERSGNSHTRIFEQYLDELSNFKKPTLGTENLEQGLFIPTADVWEKFYDPLHVLQRAVHRLDFQNSMERFKNYVRQEKKMPKSDVLWPPYRLPIQYNDKYSDTSCILQSRILHSMILGILYRALHPPHASEHMLSLAIFLLEMAVMHMDREPKDALECNQSNSAMPGEIPELLNVYSGDCLAANLRHHVNRIAITSNELQSAPAYSSSTFDSDIEWETSDNEQLQTLMPNAANMALDMDVVMNRDRSLVLRTDNNDDDDDSPMEEVYVSYPSLPAAETVHTIAEYTPQRQPHQMNPQAQLALPAITTLPNDTGLEIAVRRAMGLVPANVSPRQPFSNPPPGTILPFQRVQPVAVPSRNLDMVSTADNQRGHFAASFRANIIDGNASNTDSIAIDESILSLLLKLHSQLSTVDSSSLDERGANDKMADSNAMDISEAGPSSSTNTSQMNYKHIEVSESRIGDGPHFIGNLLRKIARADESCAQAINDIRQRLWPNQHEKQAEQRAREKEDFSQRARERQRKLLEDMAKNQKRFMERTEDENRCDDDEKELSDSSFEEGGKEGGKDGGKKYLCTNCLVTGPSTESKPIGLVVLNESSGLIGHRRRHAEQFTLPLDSMKTALLAESSLNRAERRSNHLLNSQFGDGLWLLSSNNTHDTGTFVQTCGHYIHLKCHKTYVNTLTTERQPNGEFLCPLCRQLSNAVLPLSPQNQMPVVKARDGPKKDALFKTLCAELTVLIKENIRVRYNRNTKLWDAMYLAMKNIADTTYPKLINPTPQRSFLFVTSIARTNLEAEIVQRGGSLCTSHEPRYKPKTGCLVPLLNVLSVHLRTMVKWPLWQQFITFYETQCNESMVLEIKSVSELVPNILKDPVALLIEYQLLAPLRMDIAYFTCMVKVFYNMLYYQVLIKLCASLTEDECEQVLAKYGSGETNERNFIYLGRSMALVLDATERCKSFRIKDRFDVDGYSSSNAGGSSSSTAKADINLHLLEQQLQKLCLPYLRLAALLRFHLYDDELPNIKEPQTEFVHLVYYLQLVTVDIDWNSFSAGEALYFIPGLEEELPKLWCSQLMYSRPHHNAEYGADVGQLLSAQHSIYYQPGLLRLPREYEKLFTYYHEKQCTNCGMTPRETAICLLCSTIVCLKQNCCRDREKYEAVRHSMECGGGTCIFLVVPSTLVIVIRGTRACLWGSLYLDDFHEEDRDLRRGRPLYLSEERFNLLESQWLSHRFAHTKCAWVLHRDTL